MPGQTSSIDLRPLLPAVRDQGNRGTCLAFAITSAHEVERAAGHQVIRFLSEEVLYWGARQSQRTSPAGARGLTIESARQALGKLGQPEGHLWPYDGWRDDIRADYQPPPEATDPSNCLRAGLPAAPRSVSEICQCLASGHPVVIAVQMANQRCWRGDGWLQIPAGRELVPHGHAVLAVGYVEDSSTAGGGYFTFRNSWGESWGDGGYGYMPFEYASRHCLGACTVDPWV